MAELTEDEFLAQLNAPEQETAAPENREGEDQFIQQLQVASQLGGAFGGQNQPPNIQPPKPGIERFAREGVELDTTTGAPFSARAWASFKGTPEDKAATLRHAFGGSTVDPVDDGNFIIRNVQDPETGKVKDMLVDETQMTVKDLGDLAEAGVQFGAEILTLKGLGAATKGLSRLGRLGVESAAGAGSAQLLSGSVEALRTLVERTPLQVGDIAARRAQEGASGAALGFALGGTLEGGAAALDTVTARGAGVLAPGEGEKTGLRAIQNLNQNLPQENQIVPTLGQMAQNPDALRLETIMTKIPFFGKYFRRPLEAQEQSLRLAQERALGDAPIKPFDELGAKTVETLKANVDAPIKDAKMVEDSIVLRAVDEIETAIEEVAPSARPFTIEGTAALTKLSARTQHKAFQAKADELFEAAGNPIIETSKMREELVRIQDDLPKKTVINESELVDVQGKPLATTEGKQIIRELVPDKLNRLMRGLDQLDPQMPLSELRRIRNTIDSAIQSGRGLEGVTDYELKQLQKAVTTTIEDGIAKVGDPQVAQNLARANKFYREGIERFEVPLVARLLKTDPTQPGYFAPFELISQLRTNPDRYRELESFMRSSVQEGGQAVSSTSSRQFNVIRRTLLEDTLNRARISPGATASTIDAGSFIKELKHFEPEVRASLLGGQSKTIEQNLRLLDQLKSGYKEVPEGELFNFLNRPNNSVHDLSKLGTLVRKQREDFENGLLKKFLKGDVEAGALPPDQTVDWLMNAKNSSEVQDVMRRLSSNPDVVEGIRQNALVRFFQKAARSADSSEMARLNDPTEMVSPKKLKEMLKGDPTFDKNLYNVLGDDTYNFVRNYAEAQSVVGKTGDQAMGGAGGLAATAILLDVGKVLKNLPGLAKYVVFSVGMTNPTLRRAIQEQSLKKPINTTEFTRYLISSAPVIEGLADEYGMTGLALIQDMAKKALGDDEQQAPEPAQ